MTYRNPTPAVDVVLFAKNHRSEHIYCITRKNPPFGIALPGGFVNEGESLEQAAIREIGEELNVTPILTEQFYTYSSPHRDPRKHIMSTVFIGHTLADPKAGDDALEVVKVDWTHPESYAFAFDHKAILTDVLQYIRYGSRRKLDFNLTRDFKGV